MVVVTSHLRPPGHKQVPPTGTVYLPVLLVLFIRLPARKTGYKKAISLIEMVLAIPVPGRHKRKSADSNRLLSGYSEVLCRQF